MGVASMVAMQAASKLDADITGDSYRLEQGRQATGDSNSLASAYRSIIATRDGADKTSEPSLLDSVSASLTKTRESGLSL